MAQPESTAVPPSAARPPAPAHLNAVDWAALVLLIIGGLNWGLVGLVDVDLVSTLFGGASLIARIVYLLVGLAAVYGLVMLAKLGRLGR